MRMEKGGMQGQASLGPIKELRKKRKKRLRNPRQREARHRGYGGSNDTVDKMMWDEDAPRRMKCGGEVKKMKSGGKVRGCGVAKQGVRAAKTVTMKGS